MDLTVHDTVFPDSIRVRTNNVKYMNCSNVPYAADISGCTSDYSPKMNGLESKNAGNSFMQKGSFMVNANTSLIYELENTSSIKNNTFLLLDITVLSQNTFFTSKLIATNDNSGQIVYQMLNPDYTSLITLSKSGKSLFVQFLTNCRVIVEGYGNLVQFTRIDIPQS